MTIIDSNNLTDRSATLAWRADAVRLAVERGLVGQSRHSGWVGVPGGEQIYTCVSASEPTDYELRFNERTGTISCSCRAGQHLRPCSHAGSVLLLICHLAPERSRNDDGTENTE